MTGMASPETRSDSPIPDATRRLFDGYDSDEMVAHPAWFVARLLEDGDSQDLRWLVARFGEAAVSSCFERRGARLSTRGRAFWSLVLDREPTPLDEDVAAVSRATWLL